MCVCVSEVQLQSAALQSTLSGTVYSCEHFTNRTPFAINTDHADLIPNMHCNTAWMPESEKCLKGKKSKGEWLRKHLECSCV